MPEYDLEQARKATRKKYKAALAERDVTGRQLAKMLGTSEAAISRAINGDSAPAYDRLRGEIAEKIGMEV
ncbi:helix-turn-helix domain-containing protein [Lacticaseibacillus absianus]|uniref:helix-turn-helix domain-containing protein n=1 Tax=Lacticaseibacillus absianus TaxID=2729623 RepID=UPI0015C90C93|nr:helix-turn-helix transcriptional regulator [Lacticaseibacillus absianus]